MPEGIGVIGLGKLGLCTAACLARGGFPVVGMDVREEYVARLQRGETPLREPDLAPLLERVRPRLIFTTSMEELVSRSGTAFILVPTPSDPDGSFSNRYVTEVLERMGPLLRRKEGYYLVNLVSTVMPGSAQNHFLPLLESRTGRRLGEDLGYTYNPEFVALGSVIRDFLNPDLVLIGESDPRAGGRLERIYARVCKNDPPRVRTSIENAEVAKLALNCYCTMKIAFANSLADLCARIPGTRASEICSILGLDSRIGPKALRPGLGFGGPCFPRDNRAFIRFAGEAGGPAELQEAVLALNRLRAERVAHWIARAAGRCGPEVALLGLAYKPGTWVTDASPTLDVALHLARRHPHLRMRAFDPLARTPGPWEQADTLEACVAGAHVAAILTPWPEFKDRSWTSRMASPRAVLDFWRHPETGEARPTSRRISGNNGPPCEASPGTPDSPRKEEPWDA